jgi:hypothetical protein
MLDSTTHALLQSLHSRLEALELQARAPGGGASQTPYEFPGGVGGAFIREKWFDRNWEQLKRNFANGRPDALVDDPGERPIRVSLIDPITEEKRYVMVGKAFHAFITRAWERAQQRKVVRQELVTERVHRPAFKADDPDLEWDTSVKGRNTRCLSERALMSRFH